MRTFRKFSLVIPLVFILLAITSCAPPYPPLSPSQAEMARTLHRYYYYPGSGVYYSPRSRVYYYLDNSIWLRAPRLPPHIHIDISHYIDLEIHGPKPYIYHHDHLRRYPPGLRKEKHRRQREKWDDKRRRKGRRSDHDDRYYDDDRRGRDHDDGRKRKGRDKKDYYDDDGHRKKGPKNEAYRIWK